MAKPIVDVSEHNGFLNWDLIKGQIDGAIIRCGYGGNLAVQDDKQYIRNVSECTRLNIPFGVYLFSYARNEAEALDEAEHVLRLVKGWNLKLPIYYDIEYSAYVGDLSAETYTKNANAFGKRIEQANGFVGIYANLDYWTRKLYNVNAYSRWLAQWSNAPTFDKEFKLWQYSSDGVINGSNLRTDVNRYYGDFMTMVGNKNKFGNGEIPKPEEPVTHYKEGDQVSFRALYTSSQSTQPITNIAITKGVITKVIANAHNPYLINNGTGWVNDQVIVQSTIVPEIFKVNDRVKVKKGAKDINGTSLAPFVYDTVYKVMEVKGKRIVIGNGTQVTAAISANNLMHA